MIRITILLRSALVLVLAACGGGKSNTVRIDSGEAGPQIDAALGTGEAGGVVTYMVGGRILQIAAIDGATPNDIGEKLDALASGGGDGAPSVSKNGAFITISTERFDSECNGYACTALLTGDISEGGIVYIDGQPLRSEGRVAVSNTGDVLAYADDGPSHQEDILITRKSGTTWSAPTNVTSGSPHAFNNAPVLSGDGSKVLFDCGPVPYGQAGTGVCEASTDGTDFRQVIDPANSPLGNGSSENQARHADYTPDGGIVFEADWASEQLWWQAPGSTSALRIIPSQSNDNSPCALPGGYIASLWLGRAAGNGEHELKVTAPDGSEFAVITPNVDVADIGMSCHAAYTP